MQSGWFVCAGVKAKPPPASAALHRHRHEKVDALTDHQPGRTDRVFSLHGLNGAQNPAILWVFAWRRRRRCPALRCLSGVNLVEGSRQFELAGTAPFKARSSGLRQDRAASQPQPDPPRWACASAEEAGDFRSWLEQWLEQVLHRLGGA
jgi:hypothetical protein